MLVITYGKDITKNTYDTLVASDIATYLRADYNVALKPNLVTEGPASLGATTHPEVAEGIIMFLRDFGVKRIKIIESSWIGGNTKRAFKDCGYVSLSRKYNVPFIDLKDDRCTTLELRECGDRPYKMGDRPYEMDICNEALETDFLLNIPVLKAHSQTRLTCAIKNLKGCIPDREKRRFHTIGLHKPIAVLGALLKTGYTVVDGICGDLNFEEGGNPVISNRIIAGRDPVLIDSYCAQLIGYHSNEIKHLVYSRELGVGEFYSDKTKIIELGVENKPVKNLKSNRIADSYERLIDEDSACSACYSALIFAIHRLGGRVNTKEKICIGQGFKGKTGHGAGIGNCLAGFRKCVPGCPPKAVDIVKELS